MTPTKAEVLSDWLFAFASGKAESIMLCRAAAELRRLSALCAEWEAKAATWLASPEAAQRLAVQAPVPAHSIADVVRVLRLKSNNLSRHSFFLTDPPGVKRVLDSCGNWVSVHELSELLDDSSTDWIADELGIDSDAAKWVADDLASAQEGDAMLKEIAAVLGTQKRFQGSYLDIVRQMVEAIQAPAVRAEPVAWVDERAVAWLRGRQRNATITTPLQAGKSVERPMPLYAAPQAQAAKVPLKTERWQVERAQAFVPPGMVLVPREPDEGWAYRVIRHHQPHLDVGCKAWRKELETMLHWHAAMLAAAPQPQQAAPAVAGPVEWLG